MFSMLKILNAREGLLSFSTIDRDLYILVPFSFREDALCNYTVQFSSTVYSKQRVPYEEDFPRRNATPTLQVLAGGFSKAGLVPRRHDGIQLTGTSVTR